ncbi:MAG: elongation factor P maturation arginine rhamnosyltransferase EarP [Burkholderiaceae bacterium]
MTEAHLAFGAPTGRTARRSCDLFCQVIDNFGDAGVAWRLARSLVAERGWHVRLIIDELATLARIAPALDPADDSQSALGVEVLAWTKAAHIQPAEVVIEAFGCALPEAYVERMAARTPAPVWINLEYLSAEDWVLGCHTLPSPHPRLPLLKHFFFPGFATGTGGVIIEDGLEARRQAFRRNPLERGEFLAALGADPHAPFPVFVFCYPDAPLADWARALADSSVPVQLLLAPGEASRRLASELERHSSRHVSQVRLPYVPQQDFDKLLWSSEAAIVRGEDSWVRAQLAALPFAWHAYPQTDAVHMDKLAAFARLYTVGMDPLAAAAWQGMSVAWNRGQGLSHAWPAFCQALPAIQSHAAAWRENLARIGSLTESLSDFAADQLK